MIRAIADWEGDHFELIARLEVVALPAVVIIDHGGTSLERPIRVTAMSIGSVEEEPAMWRAPLKACYRAIEFNSFGDVIGRERVMRLGRPCNGANQGRHNETAQEFVHKSPLRHF